MRISPVQLYSARNNKHSYKHEFKEQNKTFNSNAFTNFNNISFNGKAVGPSDIAKIAEIIQREDGLRADGSAKGIYRYANLIVKSPNYLSGDTSLKEYFALKQISNTGIAPKPKELSSIGNRHFIIEEFIEGKHLNEVPFKMDEVEQMIRNVTALDKTGIVNHDISLENTILAKDGRLRIIDFDNFSFLTPKGRTIHSKSVPSSYIEYLLTKEQVTGHEALKKGIIYSKDNPLKDAFMYSFEEIRKIPHDSTFIFSARNLPENPHINALSNITNYESRSLYTRLLQGEIEDPVEFLRTYTQLKSKQYHSNMLDFLGSLLSRSEELNSQGAGLSKAGTKRLKHAIKYEYMLANMFDGKPDEYFAKLQAAKLQLNAFLLSDNVDELIPNETQLHSAYEKLIKVITEGLETHQDPRHQRYLRTELRRYVDLFSETNFSITQADTKLSPSLDILRRFFNESGYDSGSFIAIKPEIEKRALDTACKVIESGGDSEITDVRDIIKDALKKNIHLTNGRVPEKKYGQIIDIMTSEIMQETKGDFNVMKMWAEGGLRITPKEITLSTYNLAQNANANAAATTAKDAIRTISPDKDKAAEALKRKYQQISYAKSGKDIFAFLGVVGVIGGLLLIDYFRNREDKEQRENEIIVVHPPKENFIDKEVNLIKDFISEKLKIFSKEEK